MIVFATISAIELDGDNGEPIDSTCATCKRCGHETESYGTSSASARRCLVLLRKECPNKESNFYREDGD